MRSTKKSNGRNSLKEYYGENGISFQYLNRKLEKYVIKKEKFFTFQILSYKKRNKYKDIPYQSRTLLEYCKLENVEYRRIARRCYYFVKKGNDITLIDEEKIQQFLESYHSRKQKEELKNTFLLLENGSSKEYRKICQFLNINYEKIKKLENESFSLKSLIYISWYSGDKYNKKGIYVSDDKFLKLKRGEELDINDLYGLYKSGQKFYLEKILEYENPYLIGFTLKTIREYNFQISKSDYEELFSEAKMIFLKCLVNNVFREAGRMVRYIEKTVTKQMLSYLIKNYSNRVREYNDALRYQEGEQYEY